MDEVVEVTPFTMGFIARIGWRRGGRWTLDEGGAGYFRKGAEFVGGPTIEYEVS